MSGTEPAILYVRDLARLLGKTETAIRAGASRRVGWLPPRLKSFRLAWSAETVAQWLREQERDQHVNKGESS